MKRKPSRAKTSDDTPDILDIDKTRLDEEWVNQPRQFAILAQKLADAKREIERCKAALELTEAELSRSIRKNPSKYDIGKITEGAIREVITIRTQSEIHDLIEARHTADELQAVVNAMDHRKRALQDLVYLFGMDYHAEPKTPRDMDLSDVKRAKDKVVFGRSKVKPRKKA